MSLTYMQIKELLDENLAGDVRADSDIAGGCSNGRGCLRRFDDPAVSKGSRLIRRHI